MEQIELKVSSRDVLGKKVRFLRRKGITPVHLFGHDVKSLALQCDTTELHRILVEAGHTRLVNLKIDNGKKARTVVVRDIQREPRTGETLHVDFYQVKMAEQVRIEVPIILVGEAPALKQKENSLVHELNSLTVECLPAHIPTSVELDISSLTEPDQVIRVRDIGLSEGVTAVNEPELVVARISTRHIEKEEEAIEAEEAEEVPETPAAHEGETREN